MTPRHCGRSSLALLLFALLLAGCGSGGGSAPTATTAPAASTGPAASVTPVAPTNAAAVPATAAASATTTPATAASAASSPTTGGGAATGTPVRTVAPTAGSTIAASNPGELFKDEKGRFSFVPDASWKNTPAPAWAARFTSQDGGNSLTVRAEQAAPGLTLDQYVDQDIEQVKKLSTGYDPGPRGRQPMTLGGESARQIDYFGMSSGLRMYNVRTYSIKGGIVYIVNALTLLIPARQAETQATSDAFHKQAAATVASWKFLV
jgi:hypothetical protein